MSKNRKILDDLNSLGYGQNEIKNFCEQFLTLSMRANLGEVVCNKGSV